MVKVHGGSTLASLAVRVTLRVTSTLCEAITAQPSHAACPGGTWRRVDSHPVCRVGVDGTTEVMTSDPFNNVSENIFEKLNKNHHQNPDHPLGIIKVRNISSPEKPYGIAAVRRAVSAHESMVTHGLPSHSTSPPPRACVQQVIFDYFDEQFNDGEYAKFDNLKPVVSTEMNFDQVLLTT